jgi:hypothetical protein
MNNKPIAYTGFFLVLASFLGIILTLAFHENVAWLRDRSGEMAAWGAFAIGFVGFVLGLLTWKTQPGKVAACFGAILLIFFLVLLLSSSGGNSPPPPYEPT